MSWKRALLACALYPALTFAAEGDVELSPQDLAYVAAQQIQFEQELLESRCGKTKFRKDVKRRHEAFAAANPEFMAALSAKPADPGAQARAEALIQQHRQGMTLLTNQLSAMPPQVFCENILRREPPNFATSIEHVRTRAAKPIPAKPVDPDAGVAEVRLTDAELDEVVRQVLENPDVAKYLHPDQRGQRPVRVALAAPYASEKLDLMLYGKPVRNALLADDGAVQLALRATATTVKVSVAYAPEGIHGTVRLARDGTSWRTTETKIYE